MSFCAYQLTSMTLWPHELMTLWACEFCRLIRLSPFFSVGAGGFTSSLFVQLPIRLAICLAILKGLEWGKKLRCFKDLNSTFTPWSLGKYYLSFPLLSLVILCPISYIVSRGGLQPPNLLKYLTPHFLLKNWSDIPLF